MLRPLQLFNLISNRPANMTPILRSTSRMLLLVGLFGLLGLMGCDSNDGGSGDLDETYTFARLEFDPDGSGLPLANVLQDTLNAANSSVEFVQGGELAILARFRDGSRIIINGTYERRGNEVSIDLRDSGLASRLLLPNEFRLVLQNNESRLVPEDEEGIRLENINLGAYNPEVYGDIEADGRLQVELQRSGGS